MDKRRRRRITTGGVKMRQCRCSYYLSCTFYMPPFFHHGTQGSVHGGSHGSLPSWVSHPTFSLFLSLSHTHTLTFLHTTSEMLHTNTQGKCYIYGCVFEGMERTIWGKAHSNVWYWFSPFPLFYPHYNPMR